LCRGAADGQTAEPLDDGHRAASSAQAGSSTCTPSRSCFISQSGPPPMEMAVVAVLGADRVGIVAGISNVLARHNVNIVDISQTVVRDIFSMIMVVDISKADVDISQLRKELEEEGRRLGVMVGLYHIDVFRYMQRI